MTDEDPRYTLTSEERDEVLALKKKCDDEGVAYNSIFELAKFCMVAVSIKDPKKRLDDSFVRIKRRRQFEEKHRLDEIDLLDAVDELEENIPKWAISCGKIDDKWCVGYTSSTSDPTYMNKAFRTICKTEIGRFDLAASDLEEARKGFYIIGTGHNLKANPLKSIKVAVNLRVLFDRMHANRVKGIYYELPRALSILSNMFLAVVPSKIKDRIHLGKSLCDMKIYKEHKEDFEANVPPELGGKYEKSLRDWVAERLAVRQETDAKVTLE